MSSEIVNLLQQSLDPSKAKTVQQNLAQYEMQSGFAIELLRLVNNTSLDQSVRLAAALSFKNLIRRKWVDASGAHLLNEQDVTAIRSEILNLMITIPEANLRAQLGESVALIADSDFPERWPDLVPSLVAKVGTDPKVNNGVLTIAHSIFKRWRPLFRSDDLFREIALVLSQFTQPYLQLMVQTNEAISQAGNNADPSTLDLLRTMSLLVKLFYDLNCQDIPEFFEDHIKDFMAILHHYLTYQNPAIEEQADDDQATVLEEIRADICEILQLYTQKYEEQFDSFVGTFVQSALSLLVTAGSQPRFDLVINRALGFLSVVASLPSYLSLFDKDNELQELIQRTVIPNIQLTENDEELFEDEPIEYIRRDFEGADSDTRRRAATDLLRELSNKLESKVTSVVTSFVDFSIQEYTKNPAENWRAKNTATYLFSSIATKGVVTSKGVSSTNLQVDIVGFFNKNVAPDLVQSSSHPILQVDAIKFIHNFRNQLTKQQLTDALGVLVQLLSSSQYVVYTCAAITIERILSIREGGILGNGSLMFAKGDIQPVAKSLVDNLMGLILKNSNNPTKLSENEFLLKCIMRVLVLIQGGSSSFADELLPTLIKIVEAISSNPANPRFSHYLFECVGATIKYNDFSESTLEQVVINPLLAFLAEDVTEFIPYTLQILTLILQHRNQPGLPAIYQQLLKPLLTPNLWEPRGNVPALVGIIEAILKQGADVVVSENLLTPLLGVFQRLLGSKANDVYAVEMLEYILTFVPKATIQPLTKDIAQVLLMKLQNTHTDKFLARFSKLVYFISASLPAQNGLGAEFAIQFLDQVQRGVFGQVFNKFVLPATLKIGGVADRRSAAIGLTNLLCQTPQFVSQEYSSVWPQGAATLVALVESNLAVQGQDVVVDVDLEELSFGNTYSPLSTVTKKPLDPCPNMTKGATEYFKENILQYSQTNPASGAQIQELMSKLSDDHKRYLQGLGL